MHNYPLSMSFKMIAFHPQLRIADALGSTVLYVKQKALALRESVTVYADERQSAEVLRIKADRVIDFNAAYTITTPTGDCLGSVRRHGMRSLWRSTYAIYDQTGSEVGIITEDNPWIKVLDSVLSEIPFAGMLVNPAYRVELRGTQAMLLRKQPSIMERHFQLTSLVQISPTDESLLLASVVMFVLLERSRG